MELLGVSEAARRLRVHPFTLRRWDESGRLKAIRDSAGRRLYTSEQIADFARQRAEGKDGGK
ncbi:MAG: MerR family DNA-binding transcriptional regulator [Armatimonadota bacterium]